MQLGLNQLTSIDNAPIDADEFWQMVSDQAYLKAEKRGFISGHEMDDWLAAEEEVSEKCFIWFSRGWMLLLDISLS
jgi:hypothetical protein